MLNIDIDRFTTATDILEGFFTAPSLLNGYAKPSRRSATKNRTHYYLTLPSSAPLVGTTAPFIVVDASGVSDE